MRKTYGGLTGVRPYEPGGLAGSSGLKLPARGDRAKPGVVNFRSGAPAIAALIPCFDLDIGAHFRRSSVAAICVRPEQLSHEGIELYVVERSNPLR